VSGPSDSAAAGRGLPWRHRGLAARHRKRAMLHDALAFFVIAGVSALPGGALLRGRR